MSLLLVVRPGLFTTIQDRGRWGYQAWGVPVSGPMDSWSARLANRLVGNPDGTGVLEVTLSGPEMSLGRDGWIAVTGARFDVEVGERAWRAPFVARVTGSASVRFGARHEGARAYVAIDGGFAVAPTLGSVSTHVRAAVGGIDGRALRPDDRIALGSPQPDRERRERELRPTNTVLPRAGEANLATLDVLAGPADEWTEAAFAALCAAIFHVSPNSDRMGYRLSGGEVTWPEGRSALLSHPTTFGSVQLPAGGDPVLLMADRQTTGGYAQIAVLSRASRALAGQLAPGDRVAFRATSWSEAREAYRQSEAALDALAAEVRP